jgi:hypothetical protein
MTLDPNNAGSPNAFVVTNTAAQTGGNLVKITGIGGQKAFNVNAGRTVLNAASATTSTGGIGLTIWNSETQTAGALTQITGEADQTALFVAAGKTILDSNSAAGLGLTVQSTATQTSGELVLISGVAGQTALKVAAGNVGIGKTPTVELDVNGGVQGTSAYTQSSDVRLKKQITPLQRPLEMILNMTGVSYTWRIDEFPDKKFNNGRQVGFIAQDLEKILPEAVRTDADGFKSVGYTTVVPVLVEAVKTQQKQNDVQQKQIDMQQKQIDMQQKQINDLKAALEQLLVTTTARP